ncbi:MAG: polyprenyl synthetase family protein [Eubacteriales bacterium]|nr:polyprenyl synthetase family protein [Eubacteriales bacterium]
MTDFNEKMSYWQQLIEARLPDCLPQVEDREGGHVTQAARYSLLAGGKRLRPVLALAAGELFGLSEMVMMPYACAIEMIHTYSLVHDDLPSMDNDELRRGRPTAHVVYGEAMAILAGDLLLNRAAEILLEAAVEQGSRAARAGLEIMTAAGGSGMIAGQSLDLAAEGNVITADELKQLQRKKTGALLSAPLLAAASLAQISPEETAIIRKFAESIGLAFQIRDDMLDVLADQAELGKTIGKDQRDSKSTVVSLYGLEQAGQLLDQTLSEARLAVEALAAARPGKTYFFAGLVDYLRQRMF